MKRTARCLQGSEEEFGRYMSDPEKSTIWSKVPHSTANLTVESSQRWKYVTGLKDHLSSINNTWLLQNEILKYEKDIPTSMQADICLR